MLVRSSLLTALLAISLTGSVLTGCGNKAPAPAPAPKPTPTSTPTSPASRHAAAARAEGSAAPSVPVVAEAKDKHAAEGAPSQPSPSAQARPARKLGPSGPMRPLTLGSFPPEITAVLGTPGLELLVDSFYQAAAQAGDLPLPPDPLAAAREALRMKLRLTDADWIAGDRPLKLAVPDPKRWPNGFIAVIPLKGGEAAVRKAFGDGLTPAEGHLGAVVAQGQRLLLDLSADTLVVTSHADIFSALEGFITGPLAAWTPPQPLVLEVNVANVNRIFAKELQFTKGMAGALGGQLTKRAAIPAQARTIKDLIDGAFNFVDNTERFGVAIDPAGPSVRLAFGLRGVDGSGLAKTIASLAGRPLSSAKLLPRDTWFGLLSDIPGELSDADRGALQGYLTTPTPDGPGFSSQEATKLIELVARLASLAAGDSALSLSVDGAFPAALSSVVGVKDGDAARQAVLAVGQIAFDKLLAVARQELAAKGGDPAQLPVSDLASAVALANQTGAPLGLKLRLVDRAEDGGVHLQALELAIDWDKTPLAKRDPETFKVVKSMVGPTLAVAIASGAGRLAFALGPRASARAIALAKGTELGGEPRLNAVAEGSFFATSLRLGRMLQALSALPSLAEQATKFATLPPAEAFILEANSDGGALTATLHVPLKLTWGLFSLGR